MQVEQVASVPLITHDPYFSIWSKTNHLNEADTVHWSQNKQSMRGYVTIDGQTYCFMGNPEFYQVIPQVSLEITATKTSYAFENELICLYIEFLSPLLLDSPLLISRPCTYITVTVQRKTAIDVTVTIQAKKTMVGREGEDYFGIAACYKEFNYAMFGKADQSVLGQSGDKVTIDWGYLYLAAPKNAVVKYDEVEKQIFATVCMENQKPQTIIVAYDDIASINYFGDIKKAYWTTKYKTILYAIDATYNEEKDIKIACDNFDKELYEMAVKKIDENYALLCIMSYRQSISAHKLIQDNEGELIFLSKENASNGCIGTVDVSYPSVPLYLYYNVEYVKAMLRPIFKFAECDVWTYDFAPHDVGRYPYATGQVYALSNKMGFKKMKNRSTLIHLPYYTFPAISDVYEIKNQMPVEECGNMLIMTAAICQKENDPTFAIHYMKHLTSWVNYLIKYGEDPGEQLCTDDFAGHLAHNINLSAKAILGIEAYAIICRLCKEELEYRKFHEIAEKMAQSWETRARVDNHTKLSFNIKDSWSLKYNLVWDIIFKSQLFSDTLISQELEYYYEKNNTYGVPLDSRASYTKSDWILWCVAMCKNRQIKSCLVKSIADYIKETKDRLPFSDFYNTEDGTVCGFIARSVQGGIFMPWICE